MRAMTMNGFIKARIEGVDDDRIVLELPDGRVLYCNDSKKICSPAMIDSVRSIVLEAIVWKVEKMDVLAYGIDINNGKEIREYAFCGQVIDIHNRLVVLETGYGMMAIVTIENFSRRVEKGDFIKAWGNSSNLGISNIASDNGRMIIE
jgi:hypothetical protein